MPLSIGLWSCILDIYGVGPFWEKAIVLPLRAVFLLLVVDFNREPCLGGATSEPNFECVPTGENLPCCYSSLCCLAAALSYVIFRAFLSCYLSEWIASRNFARFRSSICSYFSGDWARKRRILSPGSSTISFLLSYL